MTINNIILIFLIFREPQVDLTFITKLGATFNM